MPIGNSWCLQAEFGAYWQNVALTGGSWRLWAEVGAFKFWKFSKSKKLGQNFKISKKLGHSSWGKILKNPKSWGKF